MLWLAIIVALSPTLVFKGLTLEILWSWFNIHPFWFVFMIGIICFRPVFNINRKEK